MLIASGWLTTAVTMLLLVDNFFTDTAFRGTVGVDELRWKKPVYPGDTLTVETEILGNGSRRRSTWLVRCGVTVTNHDAEEIMTLTSLLLFELEEGSLR